MYASKILLTTILAMTASAATLRPTPRQIGNIACNVARGKVVGALGDAGDAVGQIQDADTQAAAQAGLDQANGGIATIAQAIVAGEAAPADGRADVEAGLAAMNAALAGGAANDAAVADAQTAVDAAAAAGQDVVAECV
ncbi:unnamed protein product [Discula destructiva]